MSHQSEEINSTKVKIEGYSRDPLSGDPSDSRVGGSCHVVSGCRI